MGDRIILNGFKTSAVAHTTAGLWRHPESRSRRYRELSYWIETARTLERGRFDALFIADAIGVQDVYRGDGDQSIKEGLQIPTDDPLPTISAMAAATERLGFGVTVSTLAQQPYLLARTLTTLDHLTDGRVGWNVVNSALRSATANLGADPAISHDDRYAIADEFLTVCYKLWEGSWADDAVIQDRAGGVFADPAKVREIRHHGRYFDVPGHFLAEPSAQRTPVIFQAGTSPAGIEFAARHAEAVFMSAPSTSVIRPRIERLRDTVEAFGRRPGDVKVISIVTVVTGADDAEARAKYEDYRSFASLEGNLSRLSGITQVDMSRFDLDQPLEYVEAPGIQSILSGFTREDPERVWTPRAIAEHMAVSSFGPLIVGGPETVADELERWVDDGGVDGFNVADILPPSTFEDFIRWVIPELRRRRRVWRDYTGSTLREYVHGAGRPRIDPRHVAAAYRFDRWKPERTEEDMA